MVHEHKKAFAIGVVVLLILFAFAAGYYAKGTLPASKAQEQKKSAQQSTSMMRNMRDGMMDHSSMVNSEADFIMEMIPHHREAIDTSQYMLSRTEDEEFKTFLQSIVVNQSEEVEMMKQWHQEWFNEPYADDGRYELMMPDLATYDDDEEARQQYLMGMIMHHMGAVQMAAKVKTVTERKELVDFANEIIKVQNAEIEQMRNWMMGNERNDGMMNHMMH